MKKRVVKELTVKVALAISSISFSEIEEFFKKAREGQYLSFTHYNYFYSYPDFAKKWKCGNLCMYHSVTTECSVCGSEASRNCAGIGTLFLVKGKGERMKLVCHQHTKGLSQWKPQKIDAKRQIYLF